MNFGNINGGAKKNAQRAEHFKFADGNNIVRLIPNTLQPSYEYWVKGPEKTLPFDCLQFVRSTEEWNNPQKDVDLVETFNRSVGDPVRDAGVMDPETGKQLNCKPAYRCLAFPKGGDKLVTLPLKKAVIAALKEYHEETGKDPMDAEEGVWVNIKKTGQKFKTEYSVSTVAMVKPDAKAPISEIDGLADLIEKSPTMSEMFPLPTYDEQKARLDRHLGITPQAKQASQEQAGPTEEDLEELNDL